MQTGYTAPTDQGDESEQDTGSGGLCFTLVAAQTNPSVTFPEILMQWERFVEGYGSHYTEQLSPQLRRREAGLLNLKLDDPVLGQLVAMKGAPYIPGVAPKFMGDVLESDIPRRSGATSTSSSAPLLMCYGLPHFAAELGDVGYLRSLLRLFPRGFPLHWLPSQPNNGHHDTFAKSGPQHMNDPIEAIRATEWFSLDTAQLPSQTPRRSTELHSFEWIAAQCPDHYGLYLSHLASFRGHIAFINFLVSTLGASFVLEEQQCTAPISMLYTWGAQRYTTGLNATQCAVGGQQVALLEWIEAEHPLTMRAMHAKSTVDALTIAAMFCEDKADVFDFFLSRNMSPISVLHTTNAENLASNHARTQNGVGGVWGQSIECSGVLRIIFAAAEVGNVAVLRWFDKAVGRADVRLMCDSHGTTILHHCARGCSTKVLETLLPASQLDDTAAMEATESRWTPLDPLWVDMEDNKGRTPAMWCVMSARKSKSVIETLEVLRRAGSDWPRSRRNGASLLDVATQFVSRHSKIVRYIHAHMRLNSNSASSNSK